MQLFTLSFIHSHTLFNRKNSKSRLVYLQFIQYKNEDIFTKRIYVKLYFQHCDSPAILGGGQLSVIGK